MTIFHVLPHLDVAGGVKVAIQHSHLLNELGHSCWVTAPDVSQNPFPGYGGARFLPWDRARGEVGRDDVVVFNWSEDIARFGGTASAHRYYFAQACFFTEPGVDDPLDSYRQRDVLASDLRLLCVSCEVQRFFLYRYGRHGRRVANWIDERTFHPAPALRRAGRVGMIEHGDYFSATVAERLGAAGFEVVCWSGSEAEVAAGMQTCEYFVGCARGVWNGARRAHGFQLPTAEAMACGCVTVSYDTGGCLDYMCDGVNAFLARTDDEEGLLAAVRRARECPDKALVADNAVRTIRSLLGKDAIRARLVAVLDLG